VYLIAVNGSWQRTEVCALLNAVLQAVDKPLVPAHLDSECWVLLLLLLLLLLLARRSMSEALMLQALPVWRGPSVCHHM